MLKFIIIFFGLSLLVFAEMGKLSKKPQNQKNTSEHKILCNPESKTKMPETFY